MGVRAPSSFLIYNKSPFLFLALSEKSYGYLPFSSTICLFLKFLLFNCVKFFASGDICWCWVWGRAWVTCAQLSMLLHKLYKSALSEQHNNLKYVLTVNISFRQTALYFTTNQIISTKPAWYLNHIWCSCRPMSVHESTKHKCNAH